MRKIILALLIVTLGVTLLNASEETLESMIVKARSARDHQAELFAKVVEREVQLAGQSFQAGNIQAGESAVGAAESFAKDCLQAAQKDNRHLKEAEILIRNSALRLDQIQQSLGYEEGAPVKEAVHELQEIDSQLLQIMFAPKEKHK